MTTINPASQFTPEDLLRLDGGENVYELVDGVLVEKTMSSLAGETATLITLQLGPVIYNQKLGKLYTESSYRCFLNKPDQVRRPDLSFISTARLAGVTREGHISIRPDLAIEVVSPGDVIYDLEEKLQDYKSAKVPLTWVFNPEQRWVRIYEDGKLKAELEDHELLHADPVLPGFAVCVSELLPATPILDQ